jgi:hypothetical protein
MAVTFTGRLGTVFSQYGTMEYAAVPPNPYNPVRALGGIPATPLGVFNLWASAMVSFSLFANVATKPNLFAGGATTFSLLARPVVYFNLFANVATTFNLGASL